MTTKRFFAILACGIACGILIFGTLAYFGIRTLRNIVNSSQQGMVAPAQPVSEMAVSKDIALNSAQVGRMIGYTPAAPTDTADRVILTTAYLTINVPAFDTSIDQITQIAKSQGGYVTDYQVSQDQPVPPIDVYPAVSMSFDYRGSKPQIAPSVSTATISLRVPADQVDATLDAIKGVGTKVVSESVMGEDVTDQYVDTEAQLKNLKATEAQLQKLMSEATTTQDTLAVFTQLSQIRGQIDQLEGQLQYFNQSAKLAKITVTLQQEPGTVVTNSITGWQPFVVVREAFNALINAISFVGDVMIWILVFIPIWLPLVALVGWIIWKKRKNKQTQI